LQEVLLQMSNSIIKELKSELEKVLSKDVFQALERVVPTGFTVYDIYSGGGIALGTFSIFTGSPGSGKTTLAIQICGNIQKQFENAILLYFDTENAVSTKRLLQLGIDVDRLIYVSRDITIEKIFETIARLIDYKESKKLIDVPFIVIWDSIAFTPSERTTATDEIQNTDGMIRAKVIAELLPRYLSLLAKYNIALIGINQYRQNVAINPYQPNAGVNVKGLQYSMPGGTAIQYAAFHWLHMQVGETIDTWGFEGYVVKCKFIKNKLAKPMKEFEMVLDTSHGFSDFWSLIYAFKKHKFLQTAGGWVYFKDYPDVKFRMKELEEKLQKDDKLKEVFEKAKQKLIAKLKQDADDMLLEDAAREG